MNYKKRREEFFTRLGPSGCAIVCARAEATNDYASRFHQNSDFFYLTGINEPEAIAVFSGKDLGQYSLFIRPSDRASERYTGPRLTPSQAMAQHGADEVFFLAQFENEISRILQQSNEVSISFGENSEMKNKLFQIISTVQKGERRAACLPLSICDLRDTLHEQRMLKNSEELCALRESASISKEAHLRVMEQVQPGMFEYELEALFAYEFRKKNALLAYQSIVASGANATILHYQKSTDCLRAGELLLVDAACEWKNLCTDITRTYPIPSGQGQRARFSAPQRELYELVLAAQLAGLAKAQPGNTLDNIHRACCEVIADGLLKLGWLTGDRDELIECGAHKEYQLHLTSHWLGMDVHDVGRYSVDGRPRTLQPGMVFTVEPGLYVLPGSPCPEEYWGIGIRIEDDVVITQSGHENLTGDLPKDIAELEKIVGSARFVNRT